MAELVDDKGATATPQDGVMKKVIEPTSFGSAGTEKETRDAVQRALDKALLAVGLEDLSIQPEQERDGSCDEKQSDRESPAVIQQVEESGEDKETPKEVDVEGEAVVKEWVDITDSFIQAASLLGPGELIQEWNFNLFDAMSAVELLDPKMDASMQWLDYRKYPRTVSEAIAKGLLQLDGHTNSQLIGIFDEVLTCVATWLNGYTLAQTVFTCLHLLETDRTESLHLRSFSIGVVKLVDYMREYICRGGVYAEDDQQGMCFGFNMLTNVSDTSVSTALKDSEERLNTSARQSMQADRQREGGMSKVTEEIRAVGTRIRFIRNLFGLMAVLKKRPVTTIQPVLAHLNQCMSLLSDIVTSSPLGEILDVHDPLKLGFHPLINHNLLPPSYRHCNIMPRTEGLASLQSMLSQIEIALGFGKLDSLKSLKEMSRDFCSQQDIPNVLARSVLVLLCIQSDRTKTFGSPSLEELLKRDAHEFSNPPSLNPRSPLYSSSQGKELTERFFGRAMHPMSELLRVYCHPRARQQDKTERVLDFLADLQHETQRIDRLQNEAAIKMDPMRQHLACYASWVLYHTLCLMIDYILMGLEYNLYSSFEYHYIYWYLEYLYGWLHTSWKTADKLNHPEQLSASGKASKKKGRRLRKEATERKEREVTIIHIRRLVSVGFMRALEAFTLEGKLQMPPFEHGSHKLCFQHRFAAFACILTPHPLAYDDYQHLAGLHNYKGKDINLYEASSRHFTTAKSALESMPHLTTELQNLLKVVKMNIVIMNLSSKGHKQDSKAKPDFDFSFHNQFPVLRIN